MRTGAKEKLLQIQEDDHILGSAEAPVRVLQYFDFECPYSKRAAGFTRRLQSRFGGQICLAFRHFPLMDVHETAQLAAEAVEAAGVQGRFWSMFDTLFLNQTALDWEDLLRYADEMNLDTKCFQEALEHGRFSKRVERDVQSGEQLSVVSTPTFFINGARYAGSTQLDPLSSLIEQTLNRRKTVA